MCKPAYQPAAGIHSKDDESRFGLSGLIQLGKMWLRSGTILCMGMESKNRIPFLTSLLQPGRKEKIFAINSLYIPFPSYDCTLRYMLIYT